VRYFGVMLTFVRATLSVRFGISRRGGGDGSASMLEAVDAARGATFTPCVDVALCAEVSRCPEATRCVEVSRCPEATRCVEVSC